MKEETIRFRCSKEQRQYLERQAAYNNLSLSSWILQVLIPVVATNKPVATEKKPVVATMPKIIKTVEDARANIPKVKKPVSTRWNERSIEAGSLLKKR